MICALLLVLLDSSITYQCNTVMLMVRYSGWWRMPVLMRLWREAGRRYHCAVVSTVHIPFGRFVSFFFLAVGGGVLLLAGCIML